MMIGRGGNTKPLKMIFEEPEKPIYVTTPQKLEETLYKIIDSVSPYNDKVDFDLIKNTHIGVVKI